MAKKKINRPAFRAVFIYLVFGVLWIIFSDAILLEVTANQEQFARFSTYKGWAYIAVTAVLLHILVRNALKQQGQIERSLAASEERWKFALEGAGEGVWDWNLVTDEVFRSGRWHSIYGYTEDEIGRTARDGRKLIHPEDLAHAVEDIEAYLAGRTSAFVSEFRLQCKNGAWKWTLSRGMVVSTDTTGKPLRMIGTHTDISERKHAEAQISRLAHYDVLTGLPNRILFHDRFEQELSRASRAGHAITLMFLDLDRFKEVNDTLGHDIGDLLLQEAARRLSHSVRTTDIVARLGGDEFTIILNELNEISVINRVAQGMLDSLAEPFRLSNETLYITASIGITIFPADAKDIEILLKNADQAMYSAKQQGRNRYSYFTPSMQQEALSRMRIANDLRLALTARQFTVYYQPIVALPTSMVHKAEALIRWNHPENGLVLPAEFIPVAEETGLISEIGDDVFDQVVAQAVHWQAARPGFQISLNKSPVQFRNDKESHGKWIQHLQALGLSGENFAVEITEGLLLDAHDSVVDQLRELRRNGIQIAIDDFGTGYSSLAYIKKFEIDYIKIDRVFTRNLAPASDDLVLCEAIIVMAHKLGIKVIAEGVETQLQHDLLLAAGCDYAQGYLYSPPLPAHEFDELLGMR